MAQQGYCRVLDQPAHTPHTRGFHPPVRVPPHQAKPAMKMEMKTREMTAVPGASVLLLSLGAPKPAPRHAAVAICRGRSRVQGSGFWVKGLGRPAEEGGEPSRLMGGRIERQGWGWVCTRGLKALRQAAQQSTTHTHKQHPAVWHPQGVQGCEGGERWCPHHGRHHLQAPLQQQLPPPHPVGQQDPNKGAAPRRRGGGGAGSRLGS